MTDIMLEDLQGEIRELAELLSIKQALELCRLFGGDNIYIPIYNERMGEDAKELQEILGEADYRKVQNCYSGTAIYFPTMQTAIKQYTIRKVREEYDGTNRRYLMRKYKLTKNRFSQIIGNKKPLQADERQLTIMDFL